MIRLMFCFNFEGLLLLNFSYKKVEKIRLQSCFILSESHMDKTREASEQKLIIKTVSKHFTKHTFLGLLAKIKCSICSYQFNI